MRLGRYHKAQNSLPILERESKIRQKFTMMNPEDSYVGMKLPAISHSTISLSSERNTRNRIKTIEFHLQLLRSELKDSRLESKETLDLVTFLREQLVEKQLNQDYQDLKGQIDGLKRLVKKTKIAHEDRSNFLREGYIELWNKTEQMRENVFSLTMRIDEIQASMGM